MQIVLNTYSINFIQNIILCFNDLFKAFDTLSIFVLDSYAAQSGS